MTWRETALVLIDQSIARWEDIERGNARPEQCGLCVHYLADDCVECPVALVYAPHCAGTGFDALTARNKKRKKVGISPCDAATEEAARPIIEEILANLRTIREKVANGEVEP